MEIEALIKKISEDKTRLANDIDAQNGLERLKAVAKEYRGEYELVWSHDTLENIKNEPPQEAYNTGLKELDNLTGGLGLQQMIGLGAQSGHGKTAFGLWLLDKYKELNPVFIALEQSPKELVRQRMKNGQFIPNFLHSKKHDAIVDPDWVEERLIEGIAKYNTKLVMIDHMGYLEAGKDYRREDNHLRIEKKLQAIKHLAMKWNVLIVILIQLDQMEEHEPPQLRNLKGSSAIRQECDKIILLWRNNAKVGKTRSYDNKVLISLQKNRQTGINGNVGSEFNFETGDYFITPDTMEWCMNLEERSKEEVNADNAF